MEEIQADKEGENKGCRDVDLAKLLATNISYKKEGPTLDAAERRNKDL